MASGLRALIVKHMLPRVSDHSASSDRLHAVVIAEGAPVTKLTLVGCCGFTVAVLSGGAGKLLSLGKHAFEQQWRCPDITILQSTTLNNPPTAGSPAQLFGQGQWYRLYSSLIPCNTLAEGIFSWLLLYRFRAFERQMGSSRFTTFLLLCGAWAVTSRLALLYLLPGLTAAGIASGPYELVFALFAYFHRESPTCTCC